MSDRFRPAPRFTQQEFLKTKELSPEAELHHLKNVSSSLLREALEKWAELWAEFQDRATSDGMILPEAEKGFTPQCGWPEFLENMWQLKLYLDSAKRFCNRCG